jgi:hypothetical protein
LSKAQLFRFAFALMLDQMVIAVLFLTAYRWKVEWLPVFSFSWQKAKKLLIKKTMTVNEISGLKNKKVDSP